MPRPPVLAAAALAAALSAGAADAQLYQPQPGYGTPLAGSGVVQGQVAGPLQVVTTRDDAWAKELFSEPAHDFGVVARGADTRTRVQIKNTTQSPVRIASVGTICSCASASLEGEKTIPPGESRTLEISMDTNRFTKFKDSAVIVQFDRPQTAEVRFPVKMYVRTDVVLTPGGVDFGAVDKGAGATRKVIVAYAGQPNWQIREVRGAEGPLEAEIKETARANSAAPATASYELTVTLDPAAPVGPVRERLLLVTTDGRSPYVPVLVQGRVEDDITVRDVELGTMAGGTTRQFNVVLRGKKPFKIAALECDGPGDRFEMKLPETERQVHVLPMAFKAPEKPGLYRETFTVTVDGREDPVTFEARGRVVGG